MADAEGASQVSSSYSAVMEYVLRNSKGKKIKECKQLALDDQTYIFVMDYVNGKIEETVVESATGKILSKEQSGRFRMNFVKLLLRFVKH